MHCYWRWQVRHPIVIFSTRSLRQIVLQCHGHIKAIACRCGGPPRPALVRGCGVRTDGTNPENIEFPQKTCNAGGRTCGHPLSDRRACFDRRTDRNFIYIMTFQWQRDDARADCAQCSQSLFCWTTGNRVLKPQSQSVWAERDRKIETGVSLFGNTRYTCKQTHTVCTESSSARHHSICAFFSAIWSVLLELLYRL